MADCEISWDIRQHLIESSLEIYRRDYGTKYENMKQFEKAEETLLEAIRNGYELTRWIPIKEKKPEMNEDIIVSYYDPIEKISGVCQGYINEFGLQPCEDFENWPFFKVIAWMPLPDPYEEGDTK